MSKNINNRLAQLRAKMLSSKIDAIIVPLSDPHNSEYMASYWQKLQWISGFTGSAGTVLVTQEHAGLWTDGRYFLQGEEQLEGSLFELHKAGLIDNATPLKWLQEHIADGAAIAMTGDMWSHNQVVAYQDELSSKQCVIKTDIDLIGDIWVEDRPALPTKEIFIHDVAYAGQTVKEKLLNIRIALGQDDTDWHLVTTMDDIGWITNLRGYDVAFNPVFIAFMIIGRGEALLYMDMNKVTNEVSEYLTEVGITLKDYHKVTQDIASLSGTILVNPEDCNEQLYSKITGAKIKHGQTISRMLKAVKNPIEQEHIHNAMVKDGVAIAQAFYWLDQHVDEQVINEADFSDRLAHYRSQQEGYYGESFPAIIGYKSNGAKMHYRPYHDTALQIKREGVLLCDSGGQYFDGTTDITRTLAMGPVSDEVKKAFTCVLKGHIALDRIHFPKGTNGAQLDVLARQYLWQQGLNYNHGTGHGVGFFMNVHEPPQGFAPGNGSRATTVFEPGMFSSNEPGYYEPGAYGIRLENLILTKESEYEGFLKHHNVTLYPFDVSMLLADMLTSEEVQWLNDYHELVADKLCPHLEEPVRTWLKDQCAPL